MNNEVKEEKPKGFVIFHGGAMKRSQLFGRGLSFLSPGMLWIILFLTLPCLSLIAVSLSTRGDYGQIEWIFTFENMKRLAGFGFFGWSADNIYILLRSVVVAVITTFICVVMSYPLAFFIAKLSEKGRAVALTFLLIPFWTNIVVRGYAWLLILGPGTPLSRFCSNLGIIDQGGALYPSAFAVYIGMVSTFLPFVVLPLYTAVEKLDWSLVEAGKDLYAGKIRIFRHGILPQTIPGLSVGITLTLIPAMGMFVIPDMLGGAKYMLVGNLIQQQFGTSRDWPFGAAVSLALMILTLVTLTITRRFNDDAEVI